MRKTYDLEARCLMFAIDVRKFIRHIPKTISNIEDGKQVVRSSGSIGANYIEANEKLGDKDFLFRLRISRKEAKETNYWLQVINGSNEFDKNMKEICKQLANEANELRLILSSIINKTRK